MAQATSSITLNDIRARILRVPRAIRDAIPRNLDTLDVRIPALDFSSALTLVSSRAYLGGVTELFRRVGILRDDGSQGRRTRVAWSYDPQANLATLDLAIEGDWQPLPGAKPADGPTPTATDPAVLVAEGLATFTPEREEARRRAASDARGFVESHLGTLTPDDVRHLLQLFNVDHRNGRPKADRFAPGFGGALANDIVASTDALNRWIPRLWEATTDAAIERVLDDFWAAKDVPGAGRSLPTMLLHVRDPEHHFPIMTGLAKGYAVLTGRSALGRTGAMYLDYARGLAELRRSYDIPVHATDLVLMAAARRGAASSETVASKPETSIELGFSGFSDAAFQFLADLAVNNNDAWMKSRREAFVTLVREPMRALVVELGTRFVQPYAPELEHEPKSPATLASIRKNAYGAVKEPYWPHYWCALHRKGLKKSQDFQLYVYIRGDELRYGFFTGSASEADLDAFANRIQGNPELAARALAEIRAAGLRLWTSDESVSTEPGAPILESPASLVELLRAAPLVIGRRVPRAEAVARGPALADDVVEAFRVLYPLFALATREDPAEALAQHWQEAEVATPDEPDLEDVYDRDDLTTDTLLAESEIEELEQLLAEKPQLILYGAPGTGKTFLAERLARYLVRRGGEMRVVQFHPSYGYEDFIEGIRPVISTGSDAHPGQVGYRVEPGIFRQMCDQARKRPKEAFVLVVDEINRGNLPRIFGELLYLLERRGPAYEVDLPISRQPFSVPTNLVVLGTMNTADQSIALVDVALRRRFHFFALSPNPPRLRDWLATHAPRMVDVARVLQKLNDALRDEGIDENLFIGHAHFMRKGLDELALQRVWKRTIEPTLEEYFYGKRDKVARFRFEAFVEGELTVAPEEAAGD